VDGTHVTKPEPSPPRNVFTAALRRRGATRHRSSPLACIGAAFFTPAKRIIRVPLMFGEDDGWYGAPIALRVGIPA
jgi:hypothetical protein